MKYQLSKNAVLAEAEGEWMGSGKKKQVERRAKQYLLDFSVYYIYILLFLLSGHSLALGDFIFSMCVKKNIACIWIFEGASV